MGIYDRDYYRTPQRSGVGQIRVWSVTTWLIILNILVFVVDGVWGSAIAGDAARYGPPAFIAYPLQELGAFTIADAIFHGQIWRFITCQFLHDHNDLWHIIFNMIGLWMFGPVVELNLGRRPYTLFYLLCGIAGPAMFTALWGLGMLAHSTPAALFVGMHTELIGASAGIFGILIAAAVLSPDRLIYVYFFELRLKYLAWIMMGIAAYTVLVHGANAGGQAAHLGGGILGWLLIRHQTLLDIAAPRRFVRGRKVKDWSRDFNR